MHRINAVPGGFQRLVQRRVHNIRIVARPAGHVIGTGPAIQQVIAIAAKQIIHRCIRTAIQRVVAVIAKQVIRAQPAEQLIIAGIAVHNVGHRVAGPIDIGRPGQRQVLEIQRQCGGKRGFHRIRARPSPFHDHVARIVHHIGVVARAAIH